MNFTLVAISILIVFWTPACRKTPQTSLASQSAQQTQEISQEDSVLMQIHQRLLRGDTTVFDDLTHDSHVVVADIDGDRSDDTIRSYFYSPWSDQEGPELNHYALLVGRHTLFGEAMSPLHRISVVDLDTTDSQKEIALTDLRASDRPLTMFFRLESDSIALIGEVPGIYVSDGQDYYGPIPDINCPGNGTVLTRVEGSILHTWSFPAIFRLDAHRRLDLVAETYRTMNTQVTLEVKLSLSTSPSDSSSSFVVEKATRAVIEVTDNVRWCRIRTSDGRVGWFAVSEDGEILGTGLRGGHVFAGLQFAG